MQKIKEFLDKPVGQITLFILGFSIGYFICKKLKPKYGNARR
jgi:hypothetical protein